MKEVEIDVSKIGFSSLVGFVNNGYPMSRGNYMMNMWCENLEHLVEEKMIEPNAKLKGMAFGKGVIITDERVPDGYLNESLCITGSHDMIEDMDKAYRFFYKELKHLACLCNEEANYVSFSLSSATMGDYPMKYHIFTFI
jgi:hypothetical protein